MGARGRSLQDMTVASVPTATSPERVARGSWDAWPTLRDPGTPAAVERGDLDPKIEELAEYARAHDLPQVYRACRARLALLGR